MPEETTPAAATPPLRALPAADAWCAPEALHEAWLGLLARHRQREFDHAELDAFAADPLARCAAISQALKAGFWRQQPLRSFAIAKAAGGQRVLRVPPIGDRVVHAALAAWLGEHCAPRLHAANHAYRAGRGTGTALRAVAAALQAGRHWALKADVREFFDNVDLDRLVRQMRGHGLWSNRLAHTLRQVLHAEVDAPEGRYCIARGLAQGSPLSPALANIVLHDFDCALDRSGAQLVRYADDFVLLANHREALEQAAADARRALGALGLELNEAKTALHPPGAAITFLGQTFSSSAPPATALGAARSGAHDGTPAGDAAAVADGDHETSGDADAAARAATPLLRTLYLVSDHSRLARDGDSLVVESPDAPVRRIPGARLNQVLAFGSTTLTSGAIALCLEYGIPVMLTTARGRHFGVVDPLVAPNVPVLTAQIDAARSEALPLEIARALVAAKLRNSALLLRRWQRHRPEPATLAAAQRIAEAAQRVQRAASLESLRGLEGAAAAAYFGALAGSIDPEWGFRQRRRQPPPDPVNSMLSYGYTVLYYNVLTLLLARGLHPHVGFLHAVRAGHHALASDMMEPFRPLAVDAVVAHLVRNGGVKPADFQHPAAAGQACLMLPHARTVLIHALEARLDARVALRGSELQLDLRRLMDMQVLSLLDRLLGRAAAFSAYTAR